MSSVVFAKELKNIRTQRAAIVPYCVRKIPPSISSPSSRASSHPPKYVISFLFAVDSKYGDITDLGGGIRKYESALSGSIREFTEESHGILGPVATNSIAHSISITDGKMATIFVRYDPDVIDSAPAVFARDLRDHSSSPSSHHSSSQSSPVCSEISRLIVVSDEELHQLTRNSRFRLEGRVMWSRVRRFYSTFDVRSLSSILKLLA